MSIFFCAISSIPLEASMPVISTFVVDGGHDALISFIVFRPVPQPRSRISRLVVSCSWPWVDARVMNFGNRVLSLWSSMDWSMFPSVS